MTGPPARPFLLVQQRAGQGANFSDHREVCLARPATDHGHDDDSYNRPIFWINHSAAIRTSANTGSPGIRQFVSEFVEQAWRDGGASRGGRKSEQAGKQRAAARGGECGVGQGVLLPGIGCGALVAATCGTDGENAARNALRAEVERWHTAKWEEVCHQSFTDLQHDCRSAILSKYRPKQVSAEFWGCTDLNRPRRRIGMMFRKPTPFSMAADTGMRHRPVRVRRG